MPEHYVCIYVVIGMVRTYTYRCARVGKCKRAALDDLFKHLAWIRNDVVAYCREEWRTNKNTPSRIDLCKRLTGMRRGNAYDASKPVRAQRSMLQRVRGGYDRFFKLGAGLPRFRREVHSFELHGSKPRRAGKCWAVQIKSVGKVRFKGHIPGNAVIRNVRIVRHALGTGFDVQLVVQLPDSEVVDDRDVVGIDLGVKAPCSLSNGAQYAPIKLSEKRRKKAQRALSRAKRQSRNRARKKLALSRESRRMAIRRRNAAHRLTAHIIKHHSANIALEDLHLQKMTARGGRRKRGLNRSMREQSLGLVIQQLAYKVESAGGKLVTVSPHNTTQACSGCGGMPRDRITLAVRTYRCAHCGLVLNRDINAARNIRMKGLVLFGRAGGPVHRAEAAAAAHAVPLALEHSSGAKHGHDAGSYR